MKSFAENDSNDFFGQLDTRLRTEITRNTKEYLLSVDEHEYKSYLIEKHKLILLEIDFNTETILKPTKKIESRRNDWGELADFDVWYFSIEYKFTGSADLMRLKPSRWNVCYADISIDTNRGVVALNFKVSILDPTYFTREKELKKSDAFSNIQNANNDANSWNSELPTKVANWFGNEKAKYINENNFYAAINVKVDRQTETVFSIPVIAKKQIPQPPASSRVELSSVPSLSNEMYNDILKVIYEFGKSMERKPSTYIGKDEEGIRDQFLLILETRYQSTSASGETFNKSGKTDILVKYANDGSNIFVAECKFWHGGSEFQKAISQLFDRYLTWRDSKAALIVFVKNKDFTNILTAIKNETAKHPYFVDSAGSRGETSFSFHFHLPNDSAKIIHFEVIAFHYDKE
jgi:hypothetical protein